MCRDGEAAEDGLFFAGSHLVRRFVFSLVCGVCVDVIVFGLCLALLLVEDLGMGDCMLYDIWEE